MDMKARGNRASPPATSKAVRRHGGGIDAAAKDLEPDLDEEAIQQRRIVSERFVPTGPRRGSNWRSSKGHYRTATRF